MKKKYKILRVIIIAECIIVAVLQKLNISFGNTFPGLIFALAFLSPILLALYWLSKDESVSPKKRTFCKVFFYFLLFCTVGATIGSLILLIS